MKKYAPTMVTVDADEAGRRLDNFLLSRLKGVPRSRIYRIIRAGEVRVNKGRAKPDYRLADGDMVRIPPVRLGTRPAAGGGVGGANLEWIENRIVYEDQDLLVLNKPSGLAVHGGSGISSGAIELLRMARHGREEKERNRLELVHRLDRDTSGCLLVAKRRASLRRLHEQFRTGQVRKRYLALLLGAWTGGERMVDAALLTNHRRGGERHVRVDPAGKPARTTFIPEKYFDDCVLATVELDTGRTHQIRVHAAHIDHPVAGDVRYGPEADSVAHRCRLTRLFLHAAELSFKSPRDDRIIRVESRLDEELNSVLNRLTKA